MVDRTGTGDPLALLPLLWGRSPKAGRTGLTLAAILDAALRLADRSGLEQVSMRKLAEELHVGPMSLYTHVPSRAELVDLLVDHVHKEIRPADLAGTTGWRDGLVKIAEANWRLYERHPWLIDVDTTRPPLGPGTIAKYDAELGALDDAGLGDIQMDQVLSLVLEHVKAGARQRWGQDRVQATTSDADWWASASPLLAALMNPRDYPLASRVGQSAGEEYQAAIDAERAYHFGLSTILDGVAVLIAGKDTRTPAGGAEERTPPRRDSRSSPRGPKRSLDPG